MQAMAEFFSAENLRGIERWFRDPACPLSQDHELKSVGNELHWTDGVGVECRLKLPDGFKPARFEQLERFSRAVARWKAALGRV